MDHNRKVLVVHVLFTSVNAFTLRVMQSHRRPSDGAANIAKDGTLMNAIRDPNAGTDDNYVISVPVLNTTQAERTDRDIKVNNIKFGHDQDIYNVLMEVNATPNAPVAMSVTS